MNFMGNGYSIPSAACCVAVTSGCVGFCQTCLVQLLFLFFKVLLVECAICATGRVGFCWTCSEMLRMPINASNVILVYCIDAFDHTGW